MSSTPQHEPTTDTVFGIPISGPPQANQVIEVCVIVKHYRPDSVVPVYSRYASRGWTWPELLGTFEMFKDSMLAQINGEDYST